MPLKVCARAIITIPEQYFSSGKCNNCDNDDDDTTNDNNSHNNNNNSNGNDMKTCELIRGIKITISYIAEMETEETLFEVGVANKARIS